MRRPQLFGLLAAATLTAAALAAALPAHAQAPRTVPVAGQNDAAAEQRLAEMSAYLRTLETFEISSDILIDQTVQGQRTVSAGSAVYRVRRPDRLYIGVVTDDRERRFFYDGTTLAMYAPQRNVYASFPAPPTIREALDKAYEVFGMSAPLAGLFFWGAEGVPIPPIASSATVGPETIGGVPTTQYVFSSERLVWRVWIENGVRPLPHRVTLTIIDDPAMPRQTHGLTWKISPPPTFGPDIFTFTPPSGAKSVNSGLVGK